MKHKTQAPAVLFLSHAPHEAHRSFAREVGARIKALPFEPLSRMTKRFPPLSYAYPYLTSLYGYFVRADTNILLVDGGSSLYAAATIKKRNRSLKLIYLDGDLLFYNLYKHYAGNPPREVTAFLCEIDGAISVSRANEKYISHFLDIPIRVCPPYPKSVKRDGGGRKNYGLYVGRLDPDKHIRRIVRFGLECPYFEKFFVVGNGTERPYVEKTSRENGKLAYVGVQQDVEQYYNRCKFLIHIPDHDPHPTTTMEAALCGCFPIISRGVGTNYLFDDSFIVDDPRDFSEINRKIRNILSNEDRAEQLLQKKASAFPKREDSLRQFKHAFSDILNCELRNKGAGNKF